MDELDRLRNYLESDPNRLDDLESILEKYGANDNKLKRAVVNFLKDVAKDFIKIPLGGPLIGLAEELISNHRQNRFFDDRITCKNCEGHGTLTYSYWICTYCNFENSMGIGLPNSPINYSSRCGNCQRSNLDIKPFDRGIICESCGGQGYFKN